MELSLAEQERLSTFLSHPQISERYTFRSMAGKGSGSLVLHAHEPRAHREVALRIPRPREALKDKLLEEMLERRDVFERVAQWVSDEGTLQLPRVPSVYALDTLEGMPYTVEQFIPGETLAQRLQRGPIPLGEAAGLFRDVAMTLRAMHEGQGIAHLDLHPGNIIVTPEHEAYVLDIGFAKAFSKNGPDTHGDWLSSTGERHSVAPEMHEQLAEFGQYAVTEQGEVYALGVNLYAMLTGSFPFDAPGLENGEARARIREAQLQVSAPFLGQRWSLLRTHVMHKRGLQSLDEVPALHGRSHLEDTVFTMLANKRVRYASVHEALDAFADALPRERSHSQRLTPVYYAATALAITGAVGLLLRDLPTRERAAFELARVEQSVARVDSLAALRAEASSYLDGVDEGPFVPAELDARFLPVIDAYREARTAIADGKYARARSVLAEGVQLENAPLYERGYELPVLLAQELLLTEEPNLDRVLRLLETGEEWLGSAPPAPALTAERVETRAMIAETRARIYFSRGFYEQALTHVDRAISVQDAPALRELRRDISERLGR